MLTLFSVAGYDCSQRRRVKLIMIVLLGTEINGMRSVYFCKPEPASNPSSKRCKSPLKLLRLHVRESHIYTDMVLPTQMNTVSVFSTIERLSSSDHDSTGISTPLVCYPRKWMKKSPCLPLRGSLLRSRISPIW
jgi:hypothetical protein